MFSKFILGLLLVCAFAFAVFAQQTGNQRISDFANVQTIASSFEMKQYVSIADKPFVTSGRFYFQKPGNLRWEYLSPYKRGIVINGPKILEWEEKLDRKWIKDISSQPAAKAMILQLYTFVSMDESNISKIYKIEDLKGGISLTPIDNSKNQAILRINILFREDIPAVKEVDIISKNGDKSIISFFDTKINEALPQNIFEISDK